MRRSLSLNIAALLITLTTGGPQVATAWEPGHVVALAARQDLSMAVLTGQHSPRIALAARQDLRDEVCLAMADGRITPAERYQIMTDAKRVLKPEEYTGLQRSLDRLSRPQPTTSTKTAWHSRQSPASVQRQTQTASADSPALVMPTSVILPDRPVVSAIGAW